MDYQDHKVAANLDILQELGLSRLEAMTYASLISMGPSHARAIFAETRMTREDTYRTLRSLASKGFIRIRRGRPWTFVAVEPRDALKNFVSKADERLSQLKRRTDELGAWLEQIHSDSSRDETDEELIVELISGPQILRELAETIKGDGSEFLSVMSGGWFTASQEMGYLDCMATMARRGVPVRVITDLQTSNREAIRTYSRKFSIRLQPKMRGLQGFTVIGRQAVVLPLTPVELGLEQQKLLWCNSPTLMTSFKAQFEQLWAETEPARVLASVEQKASRSTGTVYGV